MIFEQKGKTQAAFLMVFFAALVLASCGQVYHVGDVVLTDGKVMSSAEFASYRGSAKPEAVIFSVNGGVSENSNRVLGVKLNDEGKLAFSTGVYVKGASDESDFNATSVINQVYDEKCGVYRNDGFSGSFDGRYFGYNLNSKDLKHIDDLEKELPAYTACKGDDSYLPSASEMYKLFENVSAVNQVLASVNGAVFENGLYWSSTSDFDSVNKHLVIDMFDGKVFPDERTAVHNVRGIKCYSEKKKTSSAKYNLGDIVMDNGKVLTKDEFLSYKGKAKPMAVIFSLRGGHFEESDRVLGVGIKASEARVFASENTTGQLTNFTLNQAITINQKFNIERGYFTNAGATGVKNGSKSWENVCRMDSGKNTDISKYPAYEYAVNYGKNNGFKKYQKGWYLPSSMEVYELFEYQKIVSSSIEACGGVELPSVLWTSSQYYYTKNNQYLLDMVDGEVQVGFKSYSYPVVSVYCFKQSKKTVKE